jgi:Domain of unknown function(DUF2779)
VNRLREVVAKSDWLAARRCPAEAWNGLHTPHSAPAEASLFLVSACRGCHFFADTCLGVGLAHTFLGIPRQHSKELKQLADQGVVDLSSMPADFPLNERQERALSAALSGTIVVDPGLGAALNAISWPCHYLDFETAATMLPLYHNHGCHQQMLTQFSIHYRASPESEPRHSEYLADATRDCQRELAEHLIEALGKRGAVVVYTTQGATRRDSS